LFVEMILTPIGVVRKNSVKKEKLRKDAGTARNAGFSTRARAGTAEIEIFSRYAEGLDGIEMWPYLWVVFWFHELLERDRRVLQAHPQGNREKPKRGVFALRSPMRPNLLGLSRVRLLERDDSILVVRGLDAFEGTPVIDIKPWVEEIDANK